MREDGKVDYVEFPGGDLAGTRAFYGKAFGWTFTDYGPTYIAFNEGLDGGFNADAADQAKLPLAVLYAHDIESLEAKVRAAGATVLIGDPGRSYFPRQGLTKLAQYEVPTTRELEDMEVKKTAVWTLP